MTDKIAHREFIQRVQEEAAAFGMETFFRGGRTTAKHETISPGQFFVFWDEDQLLADESAPMADGCLYTIYPERWERIKAEAAVALTR